jgi:hypothetical protein
MRSGETDRTEMARRKEQRPDCQAAQAEWQTDKPHMKTANNRGTLRQVIVLAHY